MGYDGQGRIYIPLEEFWGFVLKNLNIKDERIYKNPRFSEHEIKIEYGYEDSDETGIDYVEPEDFWMFVAEWHPFKRAEYCYGVPRISCCDMEIDYAVSTECHPSSWATPPECLKQWDDVNKG